jgi:HK97 gp10 family phage protein
MLKFTVTSPFNRLPELRARLEAASVDKVIDEVSEELVQVARGLAPRRTGALQASIRARRTKAMNVVVEATAPHAKWVEFGTRKMPARPFMGPAVDVVKPIFIARMKELING